VASEPRRKHPKIAYGSPLKPEALYNDLEMTNNEVTARLTFCLVDFNFLSKCFLTY
jgi:hypothetical protein